MHAPLRASLRIPARYFAIHVSYVTTALVRTLAALGLATWGATAIAGDMLKPWASVISGPNVPSGYHWTYESYEYASDCKTDNAYRMAKALQDSNAENKRKYEGAVMGCVYQGSKSRYVLWTRNIGNSAVQCIAKEKKLRDYRVVLAGAPAETEDYRCE